MAVNKKEQTAEAVKAAVFSKEQLLAAERFRGWRDIVNALLAEGEQYTIAEVEQLIEKYMRSKIV